MKKNTVSSFVQKIYEILEEDENYPIIRWQDNRSSFIISDLDQFTNILLPKYFKHSNISSFIRQLNMYNFHKNRNNLANMEFYHELFRKNSKQLLIGIKRKPSQADVIQGKKLILKVYKQKELNQNPFKREEHSSFQNSKNMNINEIQNLCLSHSEDEKKMSEKKDIQNTQTKQRQNIILVMPPMGMF